MNFLRVTTSCTRKSELYTVEPVPVTPLILILFPPNSPWGSSVWTVTIPAIVVFATPTIEVIVDILSVTYAVPLDVVYIPGFVPVSYFIEFPPGIPVILYKPL